ncbi:MAG TPA: TonB-dependent receptor [Terriglobia bacterium]|nr:TonB-dependent receptor [Terriglobia bacterium]
MKGYVAIALALLCLSLSMESFGQSSNAALSGTVSDAAKALIPGVNITATNTETGVVSMALTNETGTYNIPSLLPGVYKVSAELPGFQTLTFTDVRLGNAAQIRLNFTLQVASLNTTVEVTASADRLLLESTSSVGTVLPEQAVRDLPVVGLMGNDALGLVRTLPGLNLADDLVNNANDSKLAGVSAANVQIQRDGVDASAAGRWPTGIQGATIMNPDLVGEVRMILAPVDAENGRGNAQIQVQTRSGTNRFRGAAVWNVRNSAIDPNTWVNKRVAGQPLTRNWSNLNEYTGSVGGPIVKNRTFFFALWNGLLPAGRNLENPSVLTPCARNGIFRYYDNWSNGNAFQVTQATGATPRIAVVDQAGNPMAPKTNPDGTPHNGILRYASVFGRLQNTPTRPDCSDAIVAGGPWDTNRSQMDPTGYVAKVLSVMPAINNYDVGDGLNAAGSRWMKSTRGGTNRFGIGQAVIRKQLNVKIDHNFTTNHKINAGWSYEKNRSDYASGAWPTRYPGAARRVPQVLTVNFTSTLSPTLLNEARFGMRRTGTNTTPGLSLDGPAGDEARKFVPNVQGYPILPQLGISPNGPVGFGTYGGQPNMGSEQGAVRFNGNITESSPFYTYADTMSWTHGTHSFKGGAEVRFGASKISDDVSGNDWSAFPRAHGGETPLAPIQGITSANMPGLQGTSTTGNNYAMRSVLAFLTGSLRQVNQLYYLGSADRLDKFDDYKVSTQRTREVRQQEFSFFFKDDWKVQRDLTLNLGVRFDYYGVPWIANGLTSSPVGGGNALFGISGRSFEDWMRPGQRADLTKLAFVGPGSPNADVNVWKKDWNNIGPAIGFAWQVPWFGAGQTTVRGGYQLSFLSGGGGRFSTISDPLANPPGSSYQAVINGGPGDLEYLDLTDLAKVVPVPVSVKPMEQIPITDRTVSLTAFDSNMVTPYVQNMTLAVTRNVGSNVTLDVRYIGTTGRKLYGSINLNSPNFLFNGLKEAFDAARNGGESALLDQMFKGINIAGTGFGAVGTTLNGVPQTGALHLRAATASSIRNNLANGNYAALSNTLSTLNYSKAGGINANLPDIPSGINGAVLRLNSVPENFIKTNPQFNNATLQTNAGNTNYHSLQTQVTLRPTAGISLQTSYTWSKLLGTSAAGGERGGNYTLPFDRGGDYTLQLGDRRHDLRTNGTFALPFGPEKLLFHDSSGIFARIVENWQMSWILNLSSGAPENISTFTSLNNISVGVNQLYANGVPDRVGDFDPKVGNVQWKDGDIAGNYFGGAYKKATDPQCNAIASTLRSLCTLSAITDSSGKVVLQNPQPGTRGNLGQNVIELPGSWSLDATMSKAFKIAEGKRLQFRLDATNIFNHPEPADPILNINNNDVPFGNIDMKTGNRQFQFGMRFEF